MPFSAIFCQKAPATAKIRQPKWPPSDPINLTALVDWLFPDTAPLSG
jgi:hypothetical protein